MIALTTRVRNWAAHPSAIWILVSMSFIEAIFFPIPPDVMLLPMMIFNQRRAWYYAGLTIAASIVGAAIAYCLGYCFSGIVEQWMVTLGFNGAFLNAQAWFNAWGSAAVIIAGFTPIPFKVFTLSAGILLMNFPLFMLAAVIGRSLRFGIEALLVTSFGYIQAKQIKQMMIWMSWSMILLFVLFLSFRQILYA